MRISLWSSLCFSSFTPPAAAPRSFLPSIHPSTTTIVSYVVVTDGRFRNQPPPSSSSSPFVFGPVRRFVLIILNPAPRASNFRPPPVRVSRRHGGRKGGKRKKGGMEECGEIREVFERRKWRKQISPSLLIAICTRLSLLLPLLLPPPKVSRIGISSNAY